MLSALVGVALAIAASSEEVGHATLLRRAVPEATHDTNHKIEREAIWAERIERHGEEATAHLQSTDEKRQLLTKRVNAHHGEGTTENGKCTFWDGSFGTGVTKAIMAATCATTYSDGTELQYGYRSHACDDSDFGVVPMIRKSMGGNFYSKTGTRTSKLILFAKNSLSQWAGYEDVHALTSSDCGISTGTCYGGSMIVSKVLFPEIEKGVNEDSNGKICMGDGNDKADIKKALEDMEWVFKSKATLENADKGSGGRAPFLNFKAAMQKDVDYKDNLRDSVYAPCGDCCKLRIIEKNAGSNAIGGCGKELEIIFRSS